MKRLLIFLVIVVTAIAAVPVSRVMAQAFDRRFYSSNNVLFYNPDEAPCSASADAIKSGDLSATAYEFFKEKGLDDREASAIIGNLKQVSQLNPKAINEQLGAYGIMQWTNDRKERLFENAFYSGGPASDPKAELLVQLDFLWTELQGSERAAYDALKNADTTDVGRLAIIFGEAFERYEEGAAGKRADYAEALFVQYGGATGLQTDCRSVGAGDFVYYSQKDPLWADINYGTVGKIRNAGCGPASVAMIVATFANKTVTPPIMAKLGADNGSAIPGVGTAHIPILEAMKRTYGLEYVNISNQPFTEVVSAIQRGSLVYMGGQGPAPFTGWGHVVVIRGITSDGQVVVADPYRGSSDVYSVETVQTYRGSTFEIKPASSSATTPI